LLNLKVNNDSRTLKDEFIDVTLNELAAAYRFVSSQDAETKRFLLLDDAKEISNSKFYEFKLKWIELFSDLTVDELRLLPMANDENDLTTITVDKLYGFCELFLHQPKTYLELKEFKHKGKKYNLLEPLKTISGAELLFGNGNYRQFMLGSQLTNMVKDQKNDKGIQSLKQLFALLYSDGEDSSEDIIKRSEVFGEVNALYGWSAYFFFVQLVEKYKDYFRLSMTKSPPPKVARELARQQLKALLLKTTFGKLWLSKWLKREFSVLRT
jgi:hypothetical protein